MRERLFHHRQCVVSKNERFIKIINPNTDAMGEVETRNMLTLVILSCILAGCPLTNCLNDNNIELNVEIVQGPSHLFLHTAVIMITFFAANISMWRWFPENKVNAFVTVFVANNLILLLIVMFEGSDPTLVFASISAYFIALMYGLRHAMLGNAIRRHPEPGDDLI